MNIHDAILRYTVDSKGKPTYLEQTQPELKTLSIFIYALTNKYLYPEKDIDKSIFPAIVYKPTQKLPKTEKTTQWLKDNNLRPLFYFDEPTQTLLINTLIYSIPEITQNILKELVLVLQPLCTNTTLKHATLHKDTDLPSCIRALCQRKNIIGQLNAYQIQQTASKYSRTMETYEELLRELQTTTKELTFLKNSATNQIFKYKEAIEYLDKKHDVTFNIDSNTLTSLIKVPLTIWDSTLVQTTYDIIEDEDSRKLYKAIFIDKTVQLYTLTQLDLKIKDDIIHLQSKPIQLPYCLPQPHIHLFSCWEEHRRAIQTLWSVGKYMEAVMQLEYATQQISLNDTTVVQNTLITLCSDYKLKNTLKDIKTQKFITVKEVLSES